MQLPKNDINRYFQKKEWNWLNNIALPEEKGMPSIPNGLYLLWAVLWPLNEKYDLSTIHGRLGLISWWLFTGKEEFTGIRIELNHHDSMHEIADFPYADENNPISRVAIEMARLDYEFWNSLDFQKNEDKRRILGWYYAHVAEKKIKMTDDEIKFLTRYCTKVIQDVGIPFTEAMSLCYDHRKDLQKIYNLAEFKSRQSYMVWWLKDGFKEFAPYKLSKDQITALSEPAPAIEQDFEIPITKAMALCYEFREDLKNQYDISTNKGRISFLAWWYNEGYKEFVPIAIQENDLKLISEPSTCIEQDIAIPITKAMNLCFKTREDLHLSFDLTKRTGRCSFLIWWLEAGFKEFTPKKITKEQISILLKPANFIKQDSGTEITNAMALCWGMRNDLQDAFNLDTEIGRNEFVNWWMNYGQNDTCVKVFTEIKKSEPILIKDELPILKKEKIRNPLDANLGTQLPGGINLIGLAKGELGIGEDIRMATKAMKKAEVEFCIFNFPLQCNSRENDHSVSHLIHSELVYNINLVHLTAFEHSRLLTQIGCSVFDKRYTIGAWPWELPIWPKQCEIVYNLVDEIWASTRYAMQAYKNSKVPVIHMPMTVDFDSIPQYQRDEFGLSDNVYLFLFVFDGLSYVARKNPIAHIKAFWQAFSISKKDVGLVVKMMNYKKGDATWNEFYKLALKDDRITLISETFTKEKVMGLMSVCDAFVSLHRAEGFGRCIAEMMWLGKPVITTNFSGNTDFTTHETAFLVEGPMIPVKKGEYPYGQGQYWCDPDIGDAAEKMRKCYENKTIAEKIALAGKKMIRTKYSAKTVAEKYKNRFIELGII